MKVKIIFLDEIFCLITGLSDVDKEFLCNKYAVFTENYIHSADYKIGRWDGKKKLFHQTGKTYNYLLKGILPTIKQWGYSISVEDCRRPFNIPELSCDDHIFADYTDQYGDPYIIRDYQVSAINEILKHGGGIIDAGTGAGKAQPLDCNILTTSGWVKMGDITLNHSVITPNGDISKVIGIYPQPLKDVYEIEFHDGSTTRCCNEHLWKVKRPIKLWRADTIEDVVDTNYINNFLKIKKEKNRHVPGNISIPLCEEIQWPTKDLPLDPYLLGCLLGDGHFGKIIHFSNKDDFILNEIEQLISNDSNLKNLSLNYINKSSCDYRITKILGRNHVNNLQTILKDLNLSDTRSNNKFIPDMYKNGSIEQRYHIIQGLMDTDGTCGKRNISYTTCSKQLMMDVKYIIQSLGGICTVTTRTPSFKYKGEKKLGQLAYTCFISIKQPYKLFRTPIKRDKCRSYFADGRIELMRRVKNIKLINTTPTQCISIDHPDHLYITDEFIVTHNTIISGAFTKIYGSLNLRCITIVPTASLVKQSADQFKMWKIDCGQLDGNNKELDHQHLVTTWQSLKNIPIVLTEYDVIIVDECQSAQANVLFTLLTEYGHKAPVRIGMTGTMPKFELSNLMVRMVLGDIRYIVPPNVLIEKKYLSTIDIDVIVMNENMDDDFFPDYTSETAYIRQSKPRNNWITQFIYNVMNNTLMSNSLILVTSKSYGKTLYKTLSAVHKNVFFVCGEDEVEDRAVIYDKFANDDIVVIATAQVAGVGLSIDRIFNLFMIDMGKSFVRVIQGIGRGLRRNEKAQKTSCKLFDITSSLKYSNIHTKKRIQYYKEFKYPHTVKRVDYNF